MWIVNPFVDYKETALSHDETLQLIEFSSDKGLESTFNSISNSKFWIRMKNEYPDLHEIAMRFLLCFSTTYLCTTAFSAMTVLKTKERNRMQLSDCLRLAEFSRSGMGRHGLDLSGSGYEQVPGLYECGNESSGFIKAGKFLTSGGSLRFPTRTLLYGIITYGS